MTSDILINKIETIRRCVQRIHEVYENDDGNLHDYTKQDSMILNLQRACEASIDIAMHLVSEQKLGVPQSSRDAFTFLQQHQIIEENLSVQMKAMVGFRNIAIHDYQTIQVPILKSILQHHLSDFEQYIQSISKS